MRPYLSGTRPRAISKHTPIAMIGLCLFACVSDRSRDPRKLLADADYFAHYYNWPKAEPLFIKAERLFRASGDKRNEMYARLELPLGDGRCGCYRRSPYGA